MHDHRAKLFARLKEGCREGERENADYRESNKVWQSKMCCHVFSVLRSAGQIAEGANIRLLSS
jgi:hypothetical protein